MDQTIGLYVLGILAVLGGIELVRFSWPDTGEEDCGYDGGWNLQPAHLGVTFGAILIVFGCASCYGGYCGWTMDKVLTTVKNLAQEYIV